MFGLAVLLAFVLYLLISMGIVKWAIRHARLWGKSTRLWGWGAAFLMYSLVFWDWIPTIATHKYYCATKSGFWIYKTLNQWKKENPGLAEKLEVTRGKPPERIGDMENYTDTHNLNPRFKWVVKKTGPLLINRWQWEKEVIDNKTNEVLARYIDFSTGNGNVGGEMPLRFWLQRDHCSEGKNNMHSMDSLVGNMSHPLNGR